MYNGNEVIYMCICPRETLKKPIKFIAITEHDLAMIRRYSYAEVLGIDTNATVQNIHLLLNSI